jgi:hypothetical protein
MSMYNAEILRSELDYKLERRRGRESSWARAEGRQDTLLRRHWRRLRTTGVAES